MSIVNKTKTDLSSFNYKKVEKSRSQPSNTSNLPAPPTRVTEVTTTNVSVDFSKLAGMSRGSNDVKQPSQNYLNMHRFNDGFGNVGLQVIKTAEDIKRWTKWNTTDGKGLLFNVKQAILQRFNATKSTRIYNPLGLFGSVVPFVHLPRHTNGTFIDFKDPPGYNKGVSKPMENADVTPSGEGTLATVGKLFDKIAGPEKARDYGFKSGNIKGSGGTSLIPGVPGKKLYSVDVHNALQVPYGGHSSKTEAKNLPEDFIKFRIRDLVNGKWLVFPAFLGTITDTVTPTWTPEKYIGRADSVHIYSGADRTVSFDFKVAAFTKQEIPIIQEKMNYLVGLAYPSYKKLFDGDTEKRPVAPYISLTIGDLFMNTPGYFSSITITMEESATWELDDGFQIPMYFTVGCEFTYIGKYLPQTLGKHYEAPFLPEKVEDGPFGHETPFLTKHFESAGHRKKYPFHQQMHNEAYKKTVGR